MWWVAVKIGGIFFDMVVFFRLFGISGIFEGCVPKILEFFQKMGVFWPVVAGDLEFLPWTTW